MPRALILPDLRHHAVARTLFPPTSLGRAITKLGFVQADPIRQPARAQDLILRHRVVDYTAGDLEKRYPKLAVEEDFFVNHGFLPRATQRLMHPRTPQTVWSKSKWTQAREVLAFVESQGVVHPREVEAQFLMGKSRNWFGGASNVATQLLDGMHYRGLVRVHSRKSGIKCYAASDAHTNPAPDDVDKAIDKLVDVAVALYAPLPERSLGELVSMVGRGVPQWRAHRAATLARARARLPSVEVEGTRWYWPEGDKPASKRRGAFDDTDETWHGQVRLLAPFDPLVWDRRRFEMFWGWAYRFEAYTPAPKRVRGYYALPLLWGDRVVGWANVSKAGSAGASAAKGSMTFGDLVADVGFVQGQAPKDKGFKRAMEAEMDALGRFLGQSA
jgi:uncharacterized protein